MSGRRATLYAGGLLAALALAGILLTVLEPAAARRSADFTKEYSAALLVRQGHPAAVYDQQALGAVIVRLGNGLPVDRLQPYSEPLAATLPFVPLTFLPVDAALRVWQAASLVLFGLALLVLQRATPLGPRAPVIGLLATVASAPAWASLLEGQASPLLLLGAALVTLSALRSGVGAAACGGLLLAIKPQYLPAFVIVLVALRRRGELIAVCGGASAMLMSSLAAGGIAGISGMVASALGPEYVNGVQFSESWAGLLAVVAPTPVAFHLGLPLFMVVTAGLLGLALKGRPDGRVIVATAACLSVLGSPHALPHDLLILVVPAWLAFELHRRRLGPAPLVSLLAVDLAVAIDLRGIGLPLGALALTVVLIVWTVIVRRRLAGRGWQAPIAA